MDLATEYHRDTWAQINLDQIHENIKNIRSFLTDNVTIFAVVKANAYGHGYIQVAREALEAGAKALAVAFLDEAIVIRNAGITAPILVLGATRPEDSKVAAEHKISLTAINKEWLELAANYCDSSHPLSVHVKCDTGMGRVGIRSASELVEVENVLLTNERLHFEGIFTHFATADEVNTDYFNEQLSLFNEMLESLKSTPTYIHSSNSAAALLQEKAQFNSVRVGIAMYGLVPSPEIKHLLPISLKPAFSLHTKLVQVKQVQKGESISYGATYQTEQEEWIGTLPIGYADGWIRRLQGQEVLVNGRRTPIVGRVCMDQCMIRLPENTEVGTEVILIGEQDSDSITMDEIAERLETINYEIPCIITNRVPRVYFKNGKAVEVVNNIL